MAHGDTRLIAGSQGEGGSEPWLCRASYHEGAASRYDVPLNPMVCHNAAPFCAMVV